MPASLWMMVMKMITMVTIIIIMAIPCLSPAHLPGPSQEGTFPMPAHHTHTHRPGRRDSQAPIPATQGIGHRGSLPGSGPQEPRAPGCVQTGFPALPLPEPQPQQEQLF